MPSQRYARPTLQRRISVTAAIAVATISVAYAATPVELQKQRHEHYEQQEPTEMGCAPELPRLDASSRIDIDAIDMIAICLVLELAPKAIDEERQIQEQSGQNRFATVHWSQHSDGVTR